MATYQVTKKFTAGNLKGQTVTETTAIEMPVGYRIPKSFISPSPYVVIACVKVGA